MSAIRRAPRPCQHPGCTGYATGQWGDWCPAHRPIPYRTKRGGTTAAWARARKLALRRDRGRCQHCGARTDLHVHHVDDDHENDVLANLLTLCATCHRAVHRNLPTTRHPTFRAPSPAESGTL